MVAIGRSLGNRLGAYQRATAGLVFNNKLLPHLFRELDAKHSRYQVKSTACRRRGDHLNGLVGIVGVALGESQMSVGERKKET